MKASVTIEGKNVRLRPMEKADVDRLWEIINEPSVRPWWGNEGRADLVRYLTDPDNEAWAIEQDGRMIGMIQCYEETDPDYRHGGMDIVLAADYQDKGYGSEALRLVAKYLFEQKGHHRLIIDPDADNERAIAAYRKIGYRPVGIMRRYARDVGGRGWHDGLLMDLLRDEFKDQSW